MKKLITLLMILLAATSLFAARNIDVDLSLMGELNSLSLTVQDDKNSDAKLNFNINLDVRGNIYFDGENGMFVELGYNMEESDAVTIAAGYAYKLPVESLDLALQVGPHFIVIGKNCVFGFDLDADFIYSMTKTVFLTFGAGIDLNFLTFGQQKARTYFDMTLAAPRFGLGFSF